ncbi:unnamed protein product [Paramecium pentaurelia]|uniref:Uncharacterized protein n=1 Tax=Paramecium pentaurelia TaxID=43138 RepID=A0A8S1RZQ8_9CILI|nr:unnamed protein product [Paramecium pentaurelia]
METQTQYQISQEDIKSLNSKYRLVFTYPAAAFTISALILKSTKFLSFPKFFRNPLEVSNKIIQSFSRRKCSLLYQTIENGKAPFIIIWCMCWRRYWVISI